MASFSYLLESALIQIEKQTRVEGHVLRDTLQGRCPCTWAVAAGSTNRSPAHFKLWLALGFFFSFFSFKQIVQSSIAHILVAKLFRI